MKLVVSRGKSVSYSISLHLCHPILECTQGTHRVQNPGSAPKLVDQEFTFGRVLYSAGSSPGNLWNLVHVDGP